MFDQTFKQVRALIHGQIECNALFVPVNAMIEAIPFIWLLTGIVVEIVLWGQGGQFPRHSAPPDIQTIPGLDFNNFGPHITQKAGGVRAGPGLG